MNKRTHHKKKTETSGRFVLLWAVLCGLGFWACSKAQKSDLDDAPVRPIGARTSESAKIARSEVKSVNDAKLFANYLPSMGRLVQPLSAEQLENPDTPSELVCTAFYLGEGLVLTSGTCVKECKSLKITWIKQDTASAEGGNETTCSEVVSRSDTDESNYAVLKVVEVDKLPTEFVRLSLNTNVTGKREAVLLGFDSGPNQNVWMSSGCSVSAGTSYEGNVGGINSHDCEVSSGSLGALLFSKSDRSALALFSKRLDGINVVTGFKKITVPEPTPTVEPTPDPTPAP